MYVFGFQILRRGGHVNDRDGLSDSTLLHFAAKSGASGVGDIEEACRIVSMLIGKVRNMAIDNEGVIKLTRLHNA